MSDVEMRAAYHEHLQNVPPSLRGATTQHAFEAGWAARAKFERAQRREAMVDKAKPQRDSLSGIRALTPEEVAKLPKNPCDRCLKRAAKVQVPVFGSPGKPGISANVCRECAKDERISPDTNLEEHNDVSRWTKRIIAVLRMKYDEFDGTPRGLARLQRDVVRVQYGAGPRVMEEIERILATCDLVWGQDRSG